ncbi:hypothetical protein G7Y89_g4067 [Cudoniella acicularis]|uniref:AB hydrolase-1 domain-containing protein n=1 Tax=Cudoniella acicularis TaxID=354080 RepID=A0A8H4RQ72_9HELO|nr:hypothetical protein G7Y89_g4067 [Cudoniella acicularis]
MSSSIFEIKEHTVECQHIREYTRATADSQEAVLHLAVKQYTPLDNLKPQSGDVTIIGAHANGFPKATLSKFIHELVLIVIRNYMSPFGTTYTHRLNGVLNEQLLGDDPSWFDHSRDLLHMINIHRASMPMPILGMGHSFGGNILCNLAFMHPRLLSTVILMDPVIQQHASAPKGPSPARSSAFRRDLWPSREEAIAAFRKSKFYSTWDPRVFDRWCKYGIRETPTNIYPNEKGAVTLTTTKNHECFTFMRPSWEGVAPDGATVLRRELVPDWSTTHVVRVKEVLLEEVGHLVAMEASEKCAKAAAEWLGQETKRFEAERKEYEEWTKRPLVEKQTLSEEWKRHIGGPPERTAPKSKI